MVKEDIFEVEMGPENMATQIDGIGVIHLTMAIRPEIKSPFKI